MSKLLKGGVVLIHGENDDKITPNKTDILIQDDRIIEISADITPPKGCDVLDCTDKIISPGFVDTHHHLWQTMLKGLFGNAQLVPYIAVINALSLHITPEELYWGNLSGCMEAIDAGTTTILDHAHHNWSPNHSKPAIAGTIGSGVRSIYAYTPTGLLKSTVPEVVFAEELIPSWVMETMENLSKLQPLSDPNSRVKLGFGFDFWFLPKEAINGLISQARSFGAELVTSHAVKFNGERSESTIKKVKDYGLLDHRIVFSHAGGATTEDVELLKEANAFVSVTPNTEQSMAVGPCVCFRDDLPGSDSVCSLGVDCHCVTSSSIVNEMRMALQSARAMDSINHRNNCVIPEKVFHTTEEAFNLGTIQGARALNMESDIGSIAVGKKADLVVFDMLSPAMLGAAQVDPVMAIVMHSNIGDIEAVLVDGEYRKKGRKLLDVKTVAWQEEGKLHETEETLRWADVGKKVLESQERLVQLLPNLGLVQLEKELRQRFSYY